MRSTTKTLMRLGVGASFLAANALAQTSSSRTPVAFTYTSPSECPQRSEFVARVNARQSVRSASEVDNALDELLSRVVVEPSRTLGYVYFRDPRLEARKVSAGTCDEVVTGLSLIAGVSLDGPARAPDAVAVDGDERNRDPDATKDPAAKVSNQPGVSAQTPPTVAPSSGSTSERQTATASVAVGARPYGVPPTAQTGAATQGARPTVLAPASAAPVPRKSTASAASASAPNASTAPRARAANASADAVSPEAAGASQSAPATARPTDDVARRNEDDTEAHRTVDAQTTMLAQVSEISVGVGVSVGVWTGYTRPEARINGFFELGDRRSTWAARAYGFAAWGDDAASSWSATWRTYGGRLEGCPIFGGTGWHLAVCAVGELGATVVQADSNVGNVARDTSLLWADIGAAIRVGSPRLWKVNWEAQLDAVVPLTRYELVFERPAVTMARVPSVAVVLSLGGRLNF